MKDGLPLGKILATPLPGRPRYGWYTDLTCPDEALPFRTHAVYRYCVPRHAFTSPSTGTCQYRGMSAPLSGLLDDRDRATPARTSLVTLTTVGVGYRGCTYTLLPSGRAGCRRAAVRVFSSTVGPGLTGGRRLTTVADRDPVHAHGVDTEPALAAVVVPGALHTLPQRVFAVVRVALLVPVTLVTDGSVLVTPAAGAEPAGAAVVFCVTFDAYVSAAHGRFTVRVAAAPLAEGGAGLTLALVAPLLVRAVAVHSAADAGAAATAQTALTLLVDVAIVVKGTLLLALAFPAAEFAAITGSGVIPPTENTGVESAALSGEAVVVEATSFAEKSLGFTGEVVAVMLLWTVYGGSAVDTHALAAHIGPTLAVYRAFAESRHPLLTAAVFAELVHRAVTVVGAL